jgi:hypothetical protein
MEDSPTEKEVDISVAKLTEIKEGLSKILKNLNFKTEDDKNLFDKLPLSDYQKVELLLDCHSIDILPSLRKDLQILGENKYIYSNQEIVADQKELTVDL